MSDQKEQPRRQYDSTVARIAGNILSGCGGLWEDDPYGDDVPDVRRAVKLARMIVAETTATEPKV